ncbi:hypothetical protein EV121DRAFT_282052 [Schizophyllum commune]
MNIVHRMSVALARVRDRPRSSLPAIIHATSKSTASRIAEHSLIDIIFPDIVAPPPSPYVASIPTTAVLTSNSLADPLYPHWFVNFTPVKARVLNCAQSTPGHEMSIILDSPQVAVSLGVASGVPLSPILENPGVAEAASLANAADQTDLNNAEHAKSKDAGPRKPRTRGRGQQRRTSLEATTGPMNVPRLGASMRLPSTIKEEGVVKMEAAKARKEDGDVAKSQQDDGVAVEPEQNIKLVEGENSDNMSSTNKKRAGKNSKNSKQARSSDQLNPTEDVEDVSTAKKSTSKRRQYTKKSKPKDKGGKSQAAIERAGTALGRAVADVVESARGTPGTDGRGNEDVAAGGHPSVGRDAGSADAVGRPSAEGGEAGRRSAMAGGREEDAGTKVAVDSEGAVEVVARRVESAVDAKNDLESAHTKVTAVTSEVAAGSAEAGAGAVEVDTAPNEVDGGPGEVDTDARVKSKSKPRPRRNNRKGGKSKKRSGAEETEAGTGTKAAQVDAHDGAPAGAGEASSAIGGIEQLAVGGGEAQAQTREDLAASGGEQADGAPAVEGNEKAAEAAQDKKSGTRRRFWKGRAKRGGKQSDKKVAGEPADGGPAPTENGKAASADNGTAASADSGTATSADQKTTDVNERTAALALDGATDSVKGLSVDASKLSRSGTPSGKSQARRRRRAPARGGRARGGRARENAAVADAAGDSAGAHGESVHTAPVVSGVTTPVAGQVAAYSVSGTNDAFVVTRTVDIGADVPVPVVLLAVT